MQREYATLIGSNKKFLELVQRVPLLSRCDATVLISGETGTGKDMFARAVHYQSIRKGNPFVPINCAALPDHLVENELFGHAKGAFTDAGFEHKGLLAEADGGTLFFDEINSLSLLAQGKLLRLLQDGEYRPLGTNKSRTANVRVIAATNSDLKELVSQKLFRADLYHRLNILSMHIPALRERPEDILTLSDHFLTLYGCQYGRGALFCHGTAMQKLRTYHWPGNVRELQGVIQRAVILTNSAIQQAKDIDLPIAEGNHISAKAGFQAAKAQAIERFERAYLEEILAHHHGNVSQAAKAAKTERRSLQRLLKKYGLERSHFRDSS
jgi:two-component system, NtrC family, response regulator GlrR